MTSWLETEKIRHGEQEMAEPVTEVVECDILIIGGGMAGCGAAIEATYWGKGLRVVMVDKAATDRSGAVGEGLSAINCYMGMRWGWNQPEDYVEYVRNDMMGIAREDLTYDIARHVDSSVHMFEEWGLSKSGAFLCGMTKKANTSGKAKGRS
jgi:adenylylsulfate reductase, subunit A